MDSLEFPLHLKDINTQTENPKWTISCLAWEIYENSEKPNNSSNFLFY